MPNLKWLQLWSAGADFLLRFPEARQLPFQLTTASGIHRQQLSEHLFALLLAWNRCLPAALEAQKRREWLFIKDNRLAVLAGKTMLILGYGDIGKNIARVALSFGMNVTGLRRSAGGQKSEPGLEAVRIESAARLKGLLGEADYVVNILPSTAETRHIIGGAEFALMKNSALYINLGRGATTDEAALFEALRAKKIAGALIDVFETEPLPPASPLWELDNIIITGHYAGCHPGYTRMAMDIALENLERYNHGEPLKNLVDKELGY
jgi:phosphoglycerate dehydrogenase-like enzyme